MQRGRAGSSQFCLVYSMSPKPPAVYQYVLISLSPGRISITSWGIKSRWLCSHMRYAVWLSFRESLMRYSCISHVRSSGLTPLFLKINSDAVPFSHCFLRKTPFKRGQYEDAQTQGQQTSNWFLKLLVLQLFVHNFFKDSLSGPARDWYFCGSLHIKSHTMLMRVTFWRFVCVMNVPTSLQQHPVIWIEGGVTRQRYLMCCSTASDHLPARFRQKVTAC